MVTNDLSLIYIFHISIIQFTICKNYIYNMVTKKITRLFLSFHKITEKTCQHQLVIIYMLHVTSGYYLDNMSETI